MVRTSWRLASWISWATSWKSWTTGQLELAPHELEISGRRTSWKAGNFWPAGIAHKLDFF
jgi:hypothetical protein